MTLYQFNQQAAQQSDDSNQRITESGAYVGKITMAKKVISSKKQTQGIEFSFERLDGATANYITIYTFKSNGEQIFGFNQVCGIMKILNVNEFSSQPQIIEEYNFTSGQVEEVQAEVFPALMGKAIGLVLEKESYTNNKGQLKDKMVFKAAFCPTTRRTASEIINNEPATKVDKMVAAIVEKEAKQTQSQTVYQNTLHQAAKQDGYQQQPVNTPPNGMASDLEDGIPF